MAYEISRYLHLAFSLRALKTEEKQLLTDRRDIGAGRPEMNAGEIYRLTKEQTNISYTKHYEMIRKFDAMRILNQLPPGKEELVPISSLRP